MFASRVTYSQNMVCSDKSSKFVFLSQFIPSLHRLIHSRWCFCCSCSCRRCFALLTGLLCNIFRPFFNLFTRLKRRLKNQFVYIRNDYSNRKKQQQYQTTRFAAFFTSEMTHFYVFNSQRVFHCMMQNHVHIFLSRKFSFFPPAYFFLLCFEPKKNFAQLFKLVI